MKLIIRSEGQIRRIWVVKTKRGFNKKQRKEILETRKQFHPKDFKAVR